MVHRGYTKFGVGWTDAEKRAHIKAAARAAFGRGGYGDTSITDIAASAGISRRTLYAYFAHKEDLLTELLDDFLADLLRVSASESPGDVSTPAEFRAMLERLAAALIGIVLAHRDLLRIFLEGLARGDGDLAQRSDSILETFTGIIREYVEAARLRGLVRTVEPAVVASLLAGMYMETLRRVLLKGDPYPLDVWAREIVGLIERAYLAEHAT